MRFIFRRPSEPEDEAPVPDPVIPDPSPEPARHSIHSMDPRYAYSRPIHSAGQSSDSLTDYRAAYYHQRQTNETLQRSLSEIRQQLDTVHQASIVTRDEIRAVRAEARQNKGFVSRAWDKFRGIFR